MKRLFLILLFIIVIGGTVFVVNLTNETPNNITYASGIFEDKEWDDHVITYEKDVIPDAETAINIASAVFNSIEGYDYIKNAVPQEVFYDEKDKIWIVSFWEESDALTMGGDCSIALNKCDGKVLCIWFGE